MTGSKPTSTSDRPAPRDRSEQLGAELWRQLKDRRFGELGSALAEFFERLVALLQIPAPGTPQLLRRIQIMERDIILPIKLAGMAMLLQFFYFSTWISEASNTLEVPIYATRYFFWFYFLINVGFAGVLFSLNRWQRSSVEWAVFSMSLVDGIFLGALTLATGGYNSILYWLFLGLIVRSSVSVPRAASQLLLNSTLSACYVLAGVINVYIAKNLTPTEQKVLELYETDNPAEPLFLRLALLLLMTFGCYVVQVLLERQREAEEEAREFAVREVQLRSAGRLAAEFAHQIKNPLAIINNAAFSLQRALREGKADAAEQVQMIQEEVQRADRIITEVMGYAQLSEGHVERLDVIEELDLAIDRVFPPAAHYPIQIHKDYAATFPPLLMQRRHAAEAFINVLQNAREALAEKGGSLHVAALCHGDNTIEVSIADDGPGIAPDKVGKVFEAYYTTKEKGTGLGLATVKHNLELYGGSVRLDSELGKGARFVLVFPAKTLMKLAKAD